MLTPEMLHGMRRPDDRWCAFIKPTRAQEPCLGEEAECIARAGDESAIRCVREHEWPSRRVPV